MKIHYLAFALAISGCSVVAPIRNSSVDLSGRKEFKADLCSRSEVLRVEPVSNERYGIWVEKGPRILTADGRPLTQAFVCFRTDESISPLPLDAEGCVIINRYLASGRLCVMCEGYHSRQNVNLFGPSGIIPEVRLRPLVEQPPYREFRTSIELPVTEFEIAHGFDLVAGDWLPPYGWGMVEDLRVTISTNRSENQAYTISTKGVKKAVRYIQSGLCANFEFCRKGDGYEVANRSESYEDCTNTAFAVRYTDWKRGVFRAREYFGSLDEISVRTVQGSFYEEVEGTFVRRHLPEVVRLHIDGRVNPKAGLKTLEPASATEVPRRPVAHPVPEGGNKLAFGMALDERSAVCFGWTQDGAKVPEIFEKGVYTSDPASDLPNLETVYLDVTRRSDRGVTLQGLPKLRTLIELGDVFPLRYESKAFARNPNLNAVVFSGPNINVECAADAFADCSTNLTAVYVNHVYNGPRPWDTIAVENIFTRMVKVTVASETLSNAQIVPEVDARRGIVVLPVVTVGEDFVDTEYPDGRIRRFLKSGRLEKIRK